MGSKKDFKVSVVGGGIGGLVLAVGLARRGIEFNIFEQAKKFEEIGAGVGVGPNAVKVLRDFGILDEIIKVVNQPLTTKTFVVISGLPGHETIYEVRRSLYCHRCFSSSRLRSIPDFKAMQA
ncbi:hypothetical protein M422DRAFT_266851 [Sphaerobolus stellatus SS14]|uniref:FAD-binding domain-containing protein n=1 Tax=Sphaerobolus stellatus (strain SS14) TaxID=990650 RepID=A0A0C9UAB3_SPHS4|nr:hypothetical protein M422DRAFT_266851 [Sphaerobolus stellatus SS14]